MEFKLHSSNFENVPKQKDKSCVDMPSDIRLLSEWTTIHNIASVKPNTILKDETLNE